MPAPHADQRRAVRAVALVQPPADRAHHDAEQRAAGAAHDGRDPAALEREFEQVARGHEQGDDADREEAALADPVLVDDSRGRCGGALGRWRGDRRNRGSRTVSDGRLRCLRRRHDSRRRFGRLLRRRGLHRRPVRRHAPLRLLAQQLLQHRHPPLQPIEPVVRAHETLAFYFAAGCGGDCGSWSGSGTPGRPASATQAPAR